MAEPRVRIRPAALAGAAGAFGSLDTMLNVALPDLQADFGLETADLQWAVVSYVLVYAAVLLGAGQLADTIGHARVMRTGALISAVAFVLCGAAPNYGVLLVGRTLQGAGVGMVMAAAPALVTRSTSADRRGRALGVFQMSASVGLSLGPVVVGPLVGVVGWPIVFWLRAPLALLLAYSAGLGDSAERERNSIGQFGSGSLGTVRDRLDLTGIVSVAVGLGAGVLAITAGRRSGWTSPQMGIGALVSIVSFAAFARAEDRAPSPLIDVSLLRNRGFVIANLLSLVANGSMFASWLLVPGFLVDHLDSGPTQVGLVLGALSAATAVAAPIAGRATDRLGAAPVASAGLFIEASGLWLVSNLDLDSEVVSTAAALVVVGFGLGTFAVPNMSFVMGSLPDERQGTAGGVIALMRTTGILVGATVASARFGAVEQASGYISAFAATFQLAAIAAAATACASLVRPRRANRTT